MEIKIIGVLSEEEAAKYREYINAKYPRAESAIITVLSDDYVDIECMMPPVKFDRVRRITGYLVGTIDRWNDAKRAELEDRVMHM
jgi:hypothetical protein